MLWRLLERLGILTRCDHCDERYWPWEASPVHFGKEGGLSYCAACFEYYARNS